MCGVDETGEDAVQERDPEWGRCAGDWVAENLGPDRESGLEGGVGGSPALGGLSAIRLMKSNELYRHLQRPLYYVPSLSVRVIGVLKFASAGLISTRCCRYIALEDSQCSVGSLKDFISIEMVEVLKDWLFSVRRHVRTIPFISSGRRNNTEKCHPSFK